jgi:hypothetical protein
LWNVFLFAELIVAFGLRLTYMPLIVTIIYSSSLVYFDASAVNMGEYLFEVPHIHWGYPNILVQPEGKTS